jgi:hypothetical protein
MVRQEKMKMKIYAIVPGLLFCAALLVGAFAQEPGAPATSPTELDMYKMRASYAAEVVITQVDELKAFQESPAFGDLFTSSAVQSAYEDRLTTFAETLRTVQDGLLSTATGMLVGGQNQLNAAKQMMKYRETGY